MTDPTSRALQLLGLLESRAVWTGTELADTLGVTTRTLRRDIDRLRSLGYTVEADPGVGGGYALGRGQVLPPLLLDEDEAMAVTLALTTAAASGTSADGDAALRALGKIDDVMPSAMRTRVQGLRATMQVTALDGGVDSESLLACAEATRRRVRVRFGYTDRQGRDTERRVEPHHLRARGRTWFLAAYDIDRDDWRIFRVDRMRGIELTTWTFRVREDAARAAARLDEPMPVAAYALQMTVRVHCGADELRARLPFIAGRVEPVDGRTCEMRAGADDADRAAWWLANLGADFEVVEGDEVRAAVGRLAERLARCAGRVPD